MMNRMILAKCDAINLIFGQVGDTSHMLAMKDPVFVHLTVSSAVFVPSVTLSPVECLYDMI